MSHPQLAVSKLPLSPLASGLGTVIEGSCYWAYWVRVVSSFPAVVAMASPSFTFPNSVPLPKGW